MSTNLKPLNVLFWSIWLTVILAATLGAATLWLSSRVQMEQQSAQHTREVQNQLAQALILMQHVETSQRGYLLTGRAIYLDAYEDAEAALHAAIDQTARLVADRPQRQEIVVRLRQVVADKLSVLRTTIDEQKAGRADAARAIVNSDRGLQLMDQLRQLLSEIGSEQDRAMARRVSALAKLDTLSQIGAATAFLLIGTTGTLIGLYMRRCFGTLTVALQERDQTKARLQLALDAAQLGWWRYDPRRRVATGDTRFKEIFDVAKDEISIDEIRKLVHPNDAERFWSDRKAALDPAASNRPAHEYRVQRRDGEVRWVEVRWLAHFEDSRRERGTASVVGTVQDITERKEREERERLLLREVNHRTKNMLSIVNAIARQTSTSRPEDFIERFSERIQALSANQDLLVRNEWHGVEIEDLVRAQLAHSAELIGSRIAMQGPKLRLNPASAQAIGLALHELATNARRYGALSVDGGRVDIGWEVDGDTFAISWTEWGGPPVSTPEQRGFGTIVIEAMAARSTEGAVNLNHAPSGLTWHLICPRANALEPQKREPETDFG